MATDMADYCPLNQAGHRFFVAYQKPVSEFIPFEKAGETLYRKNEYAYLSCNCSVIVRRPVIQSN